MTEKEAVEIIKQVPLYRYEYRLEKGRQSDLFQALYIAVQALKELKQYRELGTVNQIKSSIKKMTTAWADLVILIEEMKKTIAEYESMGTVEELTDELYSLRTAIDFYQAIGSVTECRKAIEKQTPMKPEYIADGYADGLLCYDYAKCPICGHDFEYEINDWGSDYCSDCGQKLDWT